MVAVAHSSPPPPVALQFYRRAIEILQSTRVPFLIGGAYAFRQYTGIVRDTKDLDVFLAPDHLDKALAAFDAAGFRTEVTYPHWLAKVYNDDYFVDLIFRLGNGLAAVDDTWILHSVPGEAVDIPVRLIGPEDLVWSKSFTADRGRYDGADIAHVLRVEAGRLNWRLLVDRFEEHWRVLLNHVILFGYIYPGERDQVPQWVMQELLGRLQRELSEPAPEVKLCQGTLLSPTQYLIDVESWGYEDPRRPPRGTMTPRQLELWIEGIEAGK